MKNRISKGGSSMKQIEGLYELEIGNTKVFMIESKKNILVDTGSGPIPEELLNFMEKTGFKFKNEEEKKQLQEGAYSKIIQFLEQKKIKIDAIICTHCHNDHTGNLKGLKEFLKVPVAMHPYDISVAEGTEELPLPPAFPQELKKHLKTEPCKVDIQLKDEEFFTDDVQVIHVEGHTKGSICLLFRNHVLIAGDCVVGKNEANPMLGQNELNPPIEMFCTDYAQAIKSLNKLLHYNFNAIFFSHGKSITEKGKEKLEKMIQRII
jgi:glyoxylase-like metal-dependent hydrolase (beta-lactamase superfamily II)